jgi:hypothetical protein
VRTPKVAQKASKVAPPAAVDASAKKRRGGAKALALAHFAAVLEDPRASVARKDKAARLLLTHSTAPKGRRGSTPAAGDKGKKEAQRDAAATAGSGSKWAGLLQ